MLAIQVVISGCILALLVAYVFYIKGNYKMAYQLKQCTYGTFIFYSLLVLTIGLWG